MCTLSYLPETSASPRWILFNRDELRSRPIAVPPTLFHSAAGSYLMPVDTMGGGTWMGLHSGGFFVCLLNNYPPGEATPSANPNANPNAGFRSRGLLVKAMLHAGVFPDADIIRRELARQHYAPFFLAAFQRKRTSLWEWNGSVIRQLPAQAHNSAGILSTSSFEHERIVAMRKQHFFALPHHNADSLKSFHRSRGRPMPEKPSAPSAGKTRDEEHSTGTRSSAEGILMSRDNACTVSIAEICLGQEQGTMHYYGKVQSNEELHSPVSVHTLHFTSA